MGTFKSRVGPIRPGTFLPQGDNAVHCDTELTDGAYCWVDVDICSTYVH